MKISFFQEMPVVLMHWCGLLLIAIFEVRHDGDGRLEALPGGIGSRR